MFSSGFYTLIIQEECSSHFSRYFVVLTPVWWAFGVRSFLIVWCLFVLFCLLLLLLFSDNKIF